MKSSIIDGAIQYVFDRQNEDGGYSLLRGQPSSLEATYYAIQTLKRLGIEPPNAERAIRYLVENVVPEQGTRGFLNLHSIFYIVETLSQLGYPSEDFSDLSRGILATQNKQGGFGVEDVDVSTVSELESTYFAVSVLTRIGVSFDKGRVLGYVQGLRNRDGGFGRRGYSTLATTYYAVMTGNILKVISGSNDKIVRFVRERENPMDGFRGDPRYLGTYLEDIFYGITILRTQEEQPRYPRQIIDFVLKCRTKSRGFARSKVLGIPTLENTYHAISIMDGIYGRGLRTEVLS